MMNTDLDFAGARRDAIEEWDFGGDILRLLLGSEHSNGTVTIIEGTVHEGGPPLHIHDAEDEIVVVVEGVLTFRVGEQSGALAPGEVLWFPRGIPHAVANLSGAPCRFVTTSTPGGIEELFRAQSEYRASLPPGTPPDPAVMAQLDGAASRRAIGPPLSDESQARRR
jgi:quercetin dioxygenase-like cupin family protein